MDESTRQALLALYDVPGPDGSMLPGYDRDHADRTTRIVMQVVRILGLDPSWDRDLEVAALLHDIGRVGMDPDLFGRIFGLAQRNGFPVRIREFRARYPQVRDADATAFFLNRIEPILHQEGIPVDARVVEHVRMRMDFDRRLRQVLAGKEPDLRRLGIVIKPWMEHVMLYYYYPRGVLGESDAVRLMGMALVASENFEAFNNVRRGRDYYGRAKERLRDVFDALSGFERDRLVAPSVMRALRELTGSGKLDAIIKESRGLPADEPLSEDDLAFEGELAVIAHRVVR